MSIVLTRIPLEHVGMNGSVTQKRRSARLSHEGIEDNEPAAKKSKANGATMSAVSTKQQDGETKTTGRRKKAVYEEEVGDFTFTKKKKKRETKQPAVRNSLDEQPPTAALPAATFTPSDAPSFPPPVEPTPAPKTAQKKTRKRLPMSPEREVAGNTARRSKRLSSEKEALAHVSPQRPAHAQPYAREDGSPSAARAAPVTVEKKRTHGPGNQVEEEKVMTISLAFADTPIIRRNREMRKASKDGHRRSSAGMRGKRASSVIDEGRGHGEYPTPRPQVTSDVTPLPAEASNAALTSTSAQWMMYAGPGSAPPSDSVDQRAFEFTRDVLADSSCSKTALPHAEVPVPEFFKHISADLTEPRRMRCLLGWCGTRCLPPKPDAPKTSTPAASLEFQALQAGTSLPLMMKNATNADNPLARVIQEELSLELVSNGTLSDWFSRDETSAPQIPTRKKANPRNIANAAKAEELEVELERLKAQRAEWNEVVLSTSAMSISGDTQQQLEEVDGLSPLQPELLSGPQRAIFEQLNPTATHSPTDPEAVQHRLRTISDDLEFAIDMFAHGVHALSTTRDTAERAAEKSLVDAAHALEEREKQRAAGGNTLDQMSSLRGLARVLNSQQKRT